MSRPWLRLLDRDLPPLPETAHAVATPPPRGGAGGGPAP